MGMGEISKKLGESWKAAEQETRQRYEEMAAQDKEVMPPMLFCVPLHRCACRPLPLGEPTHGAPIMKSCVPGGAATPRLPVLQRYRSELEAMSPEDRAAADAAAKEKKAAARDKKGGGAQVGGRGRSSTRLRHVLMADDGPERGQESLQWVGTAETLSPAWLTPCSPCLGVRCMCTAYLQPKAPRAKAAPKARSKKRSNPDHDLDGDDQVTTCLNNAASLTACLQGSRLPAC
jgi:hypothetical protein